MKLLLVKYVKVTRDGNKNIEFLTELKDDQDVLQVKIDGETRDFVSSIYQGKKFYFPAVIVEV